MRDPEPEVKVEALKNLGPLCKTFEKKFIEDQILPQLNEVQKDKTEYVKMTLSQKFL